MDKTDPYYAKYMAYKTKYMKRKGLIINYEVLQEADIMYDKYVALRLCTGQVVQDMDHNFWLPEEIWMMITDMIKEDIEDMDVYNNNPDNVKFTLRLLDKYKKAREKNDKKVEAKKYDDFDTSDEF